MTHKILKCIPNLISHGAVAQAANMINVVKASYEVSQKYKDEVCVLPPHFITLMYDLYKEALYAVSESAMMGHAKDLAIINAEKCFMEKSEKATSVLSNRAQILEALRNDMSETYDSVVEKLSTENQPTNLEKSIESAPVNAALASVKDDIIKKMVEYVKLLKPEERLAMIYAMGITNFVDVKSLTTASVISENEEAFAPDEEISSQELEKAIVDTGSDKFGIYSLAEIKEKLKEAMLSHQFSGNEIEHDVLYTVVEDISDKTVSDIHKEVNGKLGLEDSAEANSLEDLLDCLDIAGEKLTEKLEMPAHVVFVVKDDSICMAGAFDKENANNLLKSSEAGLTINRSDISRLRRKIIDIKDEMLVLSDELEDANVDHENNAIVELARKISSDMVTLYNNFNADSKDINVVEASANEEVLLQIIDDHFDELKVLDGNEARLEWMKKEGDSIPDDEIKKVLNSVWREN